MGDTKYDIIISALFLCHCNVYNTNSKCAMNWWQAVELLQSPNNDMSSFPHEEVERKINKMNTDVMSDAQAHTSSLIHALFANYCLNEKHLELFI